jgi:integrase
MNWIVNPSQPLRAELSSWEAQATMDRRPRTIEYNVDLARTIREKWSWELDTRCADIGVESVARFGRECEQSSASKYNHLVCAVRVLVPAARFLRRRREAPKIAKLPTAEQFRALLDDLDRVSKSKRAALVVRLLALTGLRITEARSLKSGHILEDGLLVMSQDSKNEKSRVIPWLPGCRETVDALLRIAPRNGKPLISDQSIRTALKLACARVGIPRLSHHDFRRFFATRCIESGVDLPTIARWMGHSDGGFLLGKVYFHVLGEHTRAMAAKVRIL